MIIVNLQEIAVRAVDGTISLSENDITRLNMQVGYLVLPIIIKEKR